VQDWRRDFHQHPELGNRETRTAGIVAAHLKSLGLEVREGRGTHRRGRLLRGGEPGPLIAIRADMDALPVREEVDLPFASKAETEFRGEKVGVMHACGHDAHTAILMGVASALAARKDTLPGSSDVRVPALRGRPAGRRGGRRAADAQGGRVRRAAQAGHGASACTCSATLNVGTVGVRGGPFMAESDSFNILVKGVQTHGSRPWGGVDPVARRQPHRRRAQSIVSRRVDITRCRRWSRSARSRAASATTSSPTRWN
jgi:amidohydrolase